MVRPGGSVVAALPRCMRSRRDETNRGGREARAASLCDLLLDRKVIAKGKEALDT
jgi:hypothetical protein